MEKEVKAIKEELFRFCWYMRGGMTIEEAHNLDQQDREVLVKIIESNMETTQKTKLPFF